MPSSRSNGASREISPPPKSALNMPDFPTEGHFTPCMGQAVPAIGRHVVGSGEPPQGPPSPGPRVTDYSGGVGGINVHTVSLIPPVHPPFFRHA